MNAKLSSFIFCFASLYWSGHCCANLTDRAIIIETFSFSLNNKFVALIKSSSDADNARVDSLLMLQKILNRSLKLYSSVLAVEKLASYFGERGKNLATTTIFIHKDSIARDLISILQVVDVTRCTWLYEVSSREGIGVLEEVYLPFDSKFFAVYWCPTGGARFYEVYQTDRNSDQIVNYLGEWKPGADFCDVSALGRKADLKGIKLRYLLGKPLGKYTIMFPLSEERPPCSRKTVDDNPFGIFECLNQLLWIEFENRFNYTTDYVSLDVVNTGAASPLILDKLRDGEADAGIVSLVLSSSRMERNRFLWPLYHSRVYLMSSASYAEINFSSFFKPFARSFWLVLFAWLTVTGSTLVVLKYAMNRLVVDENENSLNYYFSIFLIPFQAMLSQGYNLQTKYSCIRVVLLMSYIVPVFFMTAYSGKLISSLANSKTIPFRNLKQFEKHASHKLIGIKESFLHRMLETDKKFASLRQKSLVSKIMPKDYEEAYTKVCSGKMTLVTELPAVTFGVLRCTSYVMDETLGTFYASMALSSRFPFVELMNRQIRRRIITGIWKKSIQKALANNFQLELSLKDSHWTQNTHFQNIQALRLQNLLLLFTILLFGLILSVIFLLIELCYWKHFKCIQSCNSVRILYAC